jgi:RimJ/RimL family protein N-acetyltransferase
VPIFNAVVAFGFFRHVRVTGLRLVGVAIGFVGRRRSRGRAAPRRIIGCLAVCGMALCYAVGQLLTGQYLAGVEGRLSRSERRRSRPSSLRRSASRSRRTRPGWKVIGSVVMLAVPLTAIAFLLFYAIIAGAGAAYASLVTYLVPPVALAYGAIFLHERLAASAFAGLALILAGVALGTGVSPSPARCGACSPRRRDRRLRRARPEDADFLQELLLDDETRPFLSAGAPGGRGAVLAEMSARRTSPRPSGGSSSRSTASAPARSRFTAFNERSRIAEGGRFALAPRFRGRGLGDEAARMFQRHVLVDLGFHRLELQVYGFNERAIAHAERVGLRA